MGVGGKKPDENFLFCFFLSFPITSMEIKIWFLSIFMMKTILLGLIIIESKSDFQDPFESDNLSYKLRLQTGQNPRCL